MSVISNDIIPTYLWIGPLSLPDMDRRTFLTVTGFGAGLAGCLDSNSDGGPGTETEPMTENDTSAPGTSPAADSGGDSNSSGNASENDMSDNTTDTNENGTDDTESEADAEADESDQSGGSGRDVTFHSCSRATVSGTFEDGDVAFANTGFYDDGLYGDTLLEDGIEFGTDVAAPFSGTVRFEIGEGSNVSRQSNEIVVEIPNYGTDGTVITSLTTQRSDYMGVTGTHANPRASECLRELEPADSGESSDGDAAGDPTFEVSDLSTNTPINAGESLELRATIRNAGDAEATADVRFVVGHDPVQVDARSVTLAPGETTTVQFGYVTPLVDNDQEFPVRVESTGNSATESVLVYGTG